MTTQSTTHQQEEGVPPVLHRTIVVGIIRNARGDTLICKKPPDRGVFPGQWGLPGGGIEPGERMEDALRREMREECGVEIGEIEPLFFTDGQHPKRYPDGNQQEVYMIFLVFACRAEGDAIRLGEEFSEYAWVKAGALQAFDLNPITADTFKRIGLL